MMNPLVFDIALGKLKPENIRNQAASCPFCDTKNLTDILEQDGHIIWLMNKYPVLQDTWQTVVIETDKCYSEYSKFSPTEAAHVLDFSLTRWHQTIETKKFKSVLYFKNYGPMSGGSIRHPHSQIIGLYNHDYKEYVKPVHFEGPLIYEGNGLRITLSDMPMIGFFEFNFIAKKDCPIPFFARQIQGTLRYILNGLSKYSTSYNIFFYDLEDSLIRAKIIPRFITSPLFTGYGLSQISNTERSTEIIEGVRSNLYFM